MSSENFFTIRLICEYWQNNKIKTTQPLSTTNVRAVFAIFAIDNRYILDYEQVRLALLFIKKEVRKLRFSKYLFFTYSRLLVTMEY